MSAHLTNHLSFTLDKMACHAVDTSRLYMW